jgi:hypothetical protein
MWHAGRCRLAALTGIDAGGCFSIAAESIAVTSPTHGIPLSTWVIHGVLSRASLSFNGLLIYQTRISSCEVGGRERPERNAQASVQRKFTPD